MTDTPRPYRSVLYIPASKERPLAKARSLPVDAIIFDLEDAVAVDEKANARDTLVSALRQGGYGERATLVRINALDTPWGEDDLVAAAECGPDAILLPKVSSPADVDALAKRLGDVPAASETMIWAMIETARGVFRAAEIALAPRMGGFVIGTNDLVAELGCKPGPDRAELMMALQSCLAAARIGRIACVDGVFNAFKDEEGLRAECAQGRRLGMDGKSLIHPAQVAIANEVFSPSAEDVDLASRQIAAFEEAGRNGQGVAVVDGRIVENLHVATARGTLARAEARRI